MGLGFVLLFWMMFFGCAGLPIAGGLVYWSWRNGRLAGTPSKVRAGAAGLLPFALIAVGLTWFFLYAAYSWSVRQVDPGLGDSWAVPLRHGYFFCMIDVTDQGYLMKDGCSGSPPVHDIRELAEVGDAIVGSTGQSRAFVFDTATGELTLHQDTGAALAQFSPSPRLQTPDHFYRSRAVLGIVDLLWENLPLTLPVLSACLSLMLNYRDILKPDGWLKLPLPFALGLVSFSIWYVVAAQTAPDDYIRIGSQKVLFKHYSLILVISAFIWAGFCATARVTAEEVEDTARGWPWYLRQVVLIGVSAFALFVPFLLFENKAVVEERIRQSLDERPFTVSIAWKDPSLYTILGKRSDDMVFCEVLKQISAKTPAEAVGKAKTAFLRSAESRQRFGSPPPDAQVKIQEQLIVAEADSGIRR